MIRQPLGLADGQHLLHGIENRGPRRLVDDDENLVERLSLRRARGPAGHLLGDGVHERDLPRCVSGDHGVTNAVERRREPLAGLSQRSSTRSAQRPPVEGERTA